MKLKYLLCLLSATASVQITFAQQTVSLPINIRPNVTATIGVKVFDNPNNSNGRTLLIHHGLAHTAATGTNLVNSIFATPSLSNKIATIVLPDLPGRGGSSLPNGMLFGDMNMEDYGNILVQTLYGLEGQGIFVDSMVGHSMGGMIIQIAQNRLIQNGSSLYNEFGITNVDLLAAAIPREVPWLIGGSGLGTLLAVPNTKYNAQLGAYIDALPDVWRLLFFTNLTFIFAPNTPTAAQVVNYGYISKEAFTASAELIGVLGYQRPTVNANVFSSAYGTVARVLCHQQDRNSLTSEQQALYQHLTGDTGISKFTIVTDVQPYLLPPLTMDFSVHDMYITNPQQILNQGMLSDL